MADKMVSVEFTISKAYKFVRSYKPTESNVIAKDILDFYREYREKHPGMRPNTWSWPIIYINGKPSCKLAYNGSLMPLNNN